MGNVAPATTALSEKESLAKQNVFDINMQLNKRLADSEMTAAGVSSNTTWISSFSDSAVWNAVNVYLDEVTQLKADFDR